MGTTRYKMIVRAMYSLGAILSHNFGPFFQLTKIKMWTMKAYTACIYV